MPNSKKVELVAQLKEKVARSKSIIFTEYQGLSVNQINDLRGKVEDSGAEMVVAKNTLLKIALKDEKVGGKELDEHLKGPTASIFAYEDAIAPLKALVEFAKTAELPTLKAGYVDGVYSKASDLEILSNLPSREELLAQVVGTMKRPISGLVTALGATQRNFVYALSAIAEKKEN